jgi:hypothetical protein
LTTSRSASTCTSFGPTRVGKTVLLGNMIKQDMDAGHGVILIDAKGRTAGDSLFSTALDYVPRHRIEDVIVMDVGDPGRPVGLNIMSQG